MRKAYTGGLLIEIPGSQGEEKAAALISQLKNILPLQSTCYLSYQERGN